ncbi:MAG: hypothetical protein HRT88_17590, partial [Lentisphaeraceae bacterium]|nr:hypothetical protein [Lentisphaeraceae bacterium]
MKQQLRDLIQNCHNLLNAASLNPHHAWRLVNFANITLDKKPSVRYVVLRDFTKKA